MLFSSGWMFVIPRILGGVTTLERRWDSLASPSDGLGRGHPGRRSARAGAHVPRLRSYVDPSGRREQSGEGGRIAERGIQDLCRAWYAAFRPAERAACRRVEDPAARHGATSWRLPGQSAASERWTFWFASRRATAGRRSPLIGLRSGTVAGHMTSILDKIGVGDEEAAKAYTLEQGLTSRVSREACPSRRRRRRERFAHSALFVTTSSRQRADPACGGRESTRSYSYAQHVHPPMPRRPPGRRGGAHGDGIEASFSSASAGGRGRGGHPAGVFEAQPGAPKRIRSRCESALMPVSQFPRGRLFGGRFTPRSGNLRAGSTGSDFGVRRRSSTIAGKGSGWRSRPSRSQGPRPGAGVRGGVGGTTVRADSAHRH